MVGMAHLSGDETVGEYVGLFGEFAVLKALRCCPSATIGADINPPKSQFPSVYELGKPNI